MTKRTPPWKTTEQLRQWINSHPESAAANAERELEELETRLRKDRAPILGDLKRLGYHVDSLYDLKEPYPDALPVLLKHLNRYDTYDRRTRISLAHALITKDMKKHMELLIEAFRNDPDHSANGPQWVLGNAIEVLYDDNYAEDVAALALDRSYGEARDCLIDALEKSNKLVAHRALEKLKSDPDMAHWITKIEVRRKKRKEKTHKKRLESLKKIKPRLKEVSMNFDVDAVPSFLKTLSGRIGECFGPPQIRKIMTEIQTMDPDERSLLDFEIKPKWWTVPLQVLIHKSDEDAVDLHFYSTSAVVAVIDDELDKVTD